MIRIKQLTLLLLTCTFLGGCVDYFNKDDKYERPPWLTGKVYTQIKEEPDLSTFARCIELTGYDSIIDVSGSYTIFAPNNEAFTLYFQGHPEYTSVEDIPIAELTEIVKYHIVQNPWSKDQLRSLDIYGWIDSLDLNNNKPKGFKRETLLLDKDHVFGVTYTEKGDIIIVDTLRSGWRRRAATDSRKFAPIFYKEYFDIYDLSTSDYEFYFDRTIDNPDDIYYVNGRITGDEIFAENGFVYNIDRVVDPLQNALQILGTQGNNHSYTDYLSLVYLFPEFTYNQEKTLDQPGASEGLEVDSLFDLRFPELTFDINNEQTKAPSGTFGLPGNVSIRYHHGLIAPTNKALDEFITEYLAKPNRWGSLESAPPFITRILANTHMSANPIYPTDLEKGFYNGELDRVVGNQLDIVQQQFGSNSTFIGTDKVIVPRAFSSITGPIYLQKGYSKVMYAIEQTGLLSALKRENEHYLFYVESDDNTFLDSSLVYYPPTGIATIGRFSLFLRSGITFRELFLNTNDLRTLLLNHIGTGIPTGIPRKEFIKNLAGNYIIINNVTGEVSGTAPTTDGYKGYVRVINMPVQISTDADNGITYDMGDWFNFTATDLFIKISSSYPVFHEYLRAAGLSLDREYRYSFISDNENYTVFVPTEAALNDYFADTSLSVADLKKFLQLHFVQGDLIFTDGNKPSGYYETTRIDEKSTPYLTVFSQIYIEPDYDVINIRGKSGGAYLSVNESSSTNALAGRNLGTGTEIFPNVVTNIVIHECDKVLLFEELDTR
jgi:uncharacterized surface protein with fasciclin (FAS1) repeats